MTAGAKKNSHRLFVVVQSLPREVGPKWWDKFPERYDHLVASQSFGTLESRFRSQRATRKHTMVGQKYFRGEGKRAFGGQKYTKYSKINNKSENFKGQYCCRGSFPQTPLVAGLSAVQSYALSVKVRTAILISYEPLCFVSDIPRQHRKVLFARLLSGWAPLPPTTTSLTTHR